MFVSRKYRPLSTFFSYPKPNRLCMQCSSTIFFLCRRFHRLLKQVAWITPYAHVTVENSGKHVYVLTAPILHTYTNSSYLARCVNYSNLFRRALYKAAFASFGQVQLNAENTASDGVCVHTHGALIRICQPRQSISVQSGQGLARSVRQPRYRTVL